MTTRLIKAIIVGAVMGIAYEFLITPYITSPINKKVENVINGK